MSSQIEQAIRQICEEKGLSYESVMETIETAMAAAYRKDFGEKNQNVEVEFDAESGDIKVFDVKTVVEDMTEEELEAMREAEMARKEAARAAAEEAEAAGALEEASDAPDEGTVEEEEEKMFNPKTDIMITEAKEVKPDAELGEVLRIALDVPGEFGRMAAQTAKQVITQKLREAEREIIYTEFKDLEGEVVTGTVQRREGRVVLIDLGRTTGVMRGEDQISTERYNVGDRLKVYIREVAFGSRGPEILVSRTDAGLVRALFEAEIPEIADESVELKAIAREGGARTKIAVWTDDDSIDPIGACIGQRGTRIQTIIAELGGEKIDIIEWNEDPVTFIINALAPAKVQQAELNEEEKSAVVTVAEDQLSLAIGRGGQNVRLAAKLTDWKINVASEEGEESGEEEPGEAEGSSADVPAESEEESTEESKPETQDESPAEGSESNESTDKEETENAS